VKTSNLTKSLLTTDGWPLRSSSWNFFAILWTFYTIVLQFLHSLHFGCKPRIIHDGFPQHSCF
jgi:hypothetical protein